MDNSTAKEILAVRRPNGEDATDPQVREAVAQAEADPTLRAWAEEELCFDRRMSDILHALPVPREGKRRLVASASSDLAHASKRGPLFAGLALAAALLVSMALWSLLRPPPVSEGLASMLGRRIIFEHRAESPQALSLWLRGQGAPAPESLPIALRSAEGLGCKRFDDGRGGTISLMCLEVEGKLVHVFVFDEGNLDLLSQPDGVPVQDGVYSTLAWRSGGHRIAIATRDAALAEQLALQAHVPVQP